MTCVSRTDFVKSFDVKTEHYALPELGEGAYVNVKGLTAKELLELQVLHGKEKELNSIEFACHLLRLTLCNDNGELLFQHEGDVKLLLDKSPGLITKLAEFSSRVSGLVKDDTDPNV